jgi:O-antigen/teichoic acid export membrane protein
MAASIVAARILGKSAYGELGIVQGTIGMFGTLAGFAMGSTATKYVAEFREKEPRRARNIVNLSNAITWVTGSLLAIALMMLAPWLSEHTLAAPHLTGCLRIGALLLLISAVNGAQIGALSGFEAFRQTAVVNAIVGVVNFPLVLGGAMVGVYGSLWGMVIAQALGCVLNHYVLRQEMRRRNFPKEGIGCVSELSVLWRFAVPALLGNILMTPVTWFCTTLLVRQPHGFEQMGAFNAANQWFNLLMWLPYMLGTVTMPILSERLGANDRARSARLLVASVKLNVSVALPIIFIGCLGSPLIMAAYGKGFGKEWLTLVITLVSAGVLAAQMPVGQIIAASDRMWTGFFLNLGWSIAFLVGAWIFLDSGSVGLASARLIAYTAQGVCALIFAWTTISNRTNATA